ncbi:ADP-ribosylglycohydrolase family protein [Clostridium sp. PL3]|uniref:ADP-ribosylglycohydrolase family protein n=1 Tax=Clostridium thailandense TaxID=2794346 RepID=A0A949TZI0_9CLOT|nr:ADP-ribosylglycohydrolase family protein [Clostridium thailandense]MBV7275528.1 ADP-ribosylglycohydrolase family protein [Clostridium thailandense]
MKKLDRILGGLFGVACGDALGGTLEFYSKKEGKEEYGYLKDIIGGGVWNLEPGEVTDDTMMTIAVAEGILENPDDPIKSIGKKFLNWYRSNPKDIGNTVKAAIEGYKIHGDWRRAAAYAHDQLAGQSAGNGTLMRCLPVALYYDNFEKMIKITKEQSRLTHFDKKAERACEIYNTIVYDYLRGKEKISTIESVVKAYDEYEEILLTSKRELNPSGYVVDSLICALWCFANTSNPEDAICEAVNLYGDSDTIGAITGGLAGVYYGIEAIPQRWREKILLKNLIYDLGEKLFI